MENKSLPSFQQKDLHRKLPGGGLKIKNFHSGVEKGMLPTPISAQRSKNKSSFLLSAGRYVRLHKWTGPNCCRKDLAA